MHITLTQSDIKRITSDVNVAILELQLALDKSSKEERITLEEEIKERTELVQYLKYNVKLNARDGKK